MLSKKSNSDYDTEWVSGGGDVITSVFSRTGNVTAQSGDYSLSQITEDSTHRSVTDVEKSTWNAKEPAITKASGFNLALSTTSTDIKMNGTQSVGVATTLPRADHVHPTDTSRAASSHTHGNLTNAGAIGSTANLPLITTTSGVVTTGAFGTSANTFCQGNDSRLSDSRTPLTHTHVTSEITGLDTSLSGKQSTLVSGTNIKTVNGNSILGSGDLTISGGVGASDPIQLADRATPSAPVSGLTLFSKKRAGRSSLNQIGSSGIDTPLQPALFGNSIYMWLPSTSTTVSIAFATTWTARNASGAQSHPVKATTNFLTQMNRALFSCTATTATSSGIQSAATVAVRGNATGIGGFFFFSRFGVETLSGSGQQVLVGLSALNATLGGEPSVQNNTIGLIKDSTDTNWFLLSRNGSAMTKTPTGLAVTAGEVLSLYMFCKSNDTKVTVRLVRENDGAVLLDDIEIVDTLPVNTTFMYAHAQLRNVGTAINALALNRIYVECDI